MSLTFSVHVYHGGYLTPPPNVKYCGGFVDCFDNLEYDKTGILNAEGYLKDLLWRNQFSAIWYSKPSCSTFDENLEPLKDDFDIMKMMKFASEHDNKISIYIERPIASDVVEAQRGNDEVGVDSVQFDHDNEDDNSLGISFEESDTSDADDNFEKDKGEEFEGVADDETEE